MGDSVTPDVLGNMIRQYIQPELCTFIFGQPHTQQLFLTIKVNT
ncbi:Uncharacterised protein [Escherichia coli]|nr:Uncharacterised protein [Escherichia coli]